VSARAWVRRRRNRYLRPYIRYTERHPDRVILLLPGETLVTSLAGWATMQNRTSSVTIQQLPNYRHQTVYRIVHSK
jgi:hypothetical protein